MSRGAAQVDRGQESQKMVSRWALNEMPWQTIKIQTDLTYQKQQITNVVELQDNASILPTELRDDCVKKLSL